VRFSKKEKKENVRARQTDRAKWKLPARSRAKRGRNMRAKTKGEIDASTNYT
jgi:hypothetical protein